MVSTGFSTGQTPGLSDAYMKSVQDAALSEIQKNIKQTANTALSGIGAGDATEKITAGKAAIESLDYKAMQENALKNLMGSSINPGEYLAALGKLGNYGQDTIANAAGKFSSYAHNQNLQANEKARLEAEARARQEEARNRDMGRHNALAAADAERKAREQQDAANLNALQNDQQVQSVLSNPGQVGTVITPNAVNLPKSNKSKPVLPKDPLNPNAVGIST
jgi:hypothetical protein